MSRIALVSCIARGAIAIESINSRVYIVRQFLCVFDRKCSRRGHLAYPIELDRTGFQHFYVFFPHLTIVELDSRKTIKIRDVDFWSHRMASSAIRLEINLKMQ